MHSSPINLYAMRRALSQRDRAGGRELTRTPQEIITEAAKRAAKIQSKKGAK